jgi:hypothetical protein
MSQLMNNPFAEQIKNDNYLLRFYLHKCWALFESKNFQESLTICEVILQALNTYKIMSLP